jgi:hypothetical protein
MKLQATKPYFLEHRPHLTKYSFILKVALSFKRTGA